MQSRASRRGVRVHFDFELAEIREVKSSVTRSLTLRDSRARAQRSGARHRNRFPHHSTELTSKGFATQDASRL